MYCPSCSSPTAEGAKFCKSCGLSLTVVTKALSGSSAASNPLREREYKRARRQVSDGIQGAAIGAALLVGAAVAYFLLPKDGLYFAVSLALALAGLIKLFRSVGHVIDAKVGPRLLESDTQQQVRGSGGLSSQAAPPAAVTTRVSQRLPLDATKPAVASPAATPLEASPPGGRLEGRQPANPDSAAGTSRVGTSRVGREHSSPLRKIEKEEEVLSRLRN